MKKQATLKLFLTIILLASTTIIVSTNFMQSHVTNADLDECTAVIVTGTAAKDGRAILMKNRDTSDTQNKPTYVAPTSEHYGYTMVNWVWMGINERGLAVMNTAVSALGFGGSGLDNGALNRWIIQHCETVEEVCLELNSTNSPIGPGKRQGGTCVGVIDRFGNATFIEISGIGAYARFIANGYDSQANHPRYYPGYASGPSGRDQYALDIMNAIHSQKGYISWEDVAQNVSRYVRNKEQGSSPFSISGEISNTGTQAAMVAISGDQRYDCKLNWMWGEYGNPPLVGLFVPSIPYAGQPPTVLNNFWNYVWQKRANAQNEYGYYVPAEVRETQAYTFFAEDITFCQYDTLISTIPDNLPSIELRTRLQEFVNKTVQEAATIYIEEPQVIAHAYTTQTNQYQITTISNSTISNYQSSNTTDFEISFNVTGTTGTTGFTYIQIPSELCDGHVQVTIGSSVYAINDPPRHNNQFIFSLTYSHPTSIRITATDTQTARACDINGDGVVDIYDLVTVAVAYGSTPTNPNWNPNADINGDNTIDIYDLIIAASHFGESWS